MPVLIGIDYGEMRIGIAVSDPAQKIALPLGVIHRTQGGYGFRKLRALLESRELVEKGDSGDIVLVDAFVVGLPLRSDGSEGEEARRVRVYAAALENHFGRLVHLWDERFTTVIANRALSESRSRHSRKKGSSDQAASQLILQSYLDHLNAGGTQQQGG